MNKRLFIIPMGLLVISLMTPVSGFADDDDNARHDEHQDLREGRQRLEKLRREGKEEIHEGRQKLEDLRHEGREEIHEHDRGEAHDRDKRDLRRDENEHEDHDRD